jgi:hypothetical protein
MLSRLLKIDAVDGTLHLYAISLSHCHARAGDDACMTRYRLTEESVASSSIRLRELGRMSVQTCPIAVPVLASALSPQNPAREIRKLVFVCSFSARVLSAR